MNDLDIQPYQDESMGLLDSPVSADIFDNDHFEILGTSYKREEVLYPCCPEPYPKMELSIRFKRVKQFEHGELKVVFAKLE